MYVNVDLSSSLCRTKSWILTQLCPTTTIRAPRRPHTTVCQKLNHFLNFDEPQTCDIPPALWRSSAAPSSTPPPPRLMTSQQPCLVGGGQPCRANRKSCRAGWRHSTPPLPRASLPSRAPPPLSN